LALHTHESLSEMEIVPGVFFAAQREHLERLLREPDDSYRVFIGHAGWAGGQLEKELREGAWLTTPATPQFIFSEASDLWRRVTQHIGKSFLGSVLRVKHIPDEPTLN